MTYSSQKVANSPLGSFPVAVDRINGSDYQLIKLDIGDENESSPVTASNPMPVISVASAAGSIGVTETVVGVTTGSSTIVLVDAAHIGGYLVNISDTTIYVSWNSPADVTGIPVLAGGVFQLTINYGGLPISANLYGIHAGVGTKNIRLIRGSL